MKKLTALLLFSFLAAVSVRADVIWYEGFNYNPPVSGSYNLTNVSLGVWNNFSGSGFHDMLLPANGRLEVSTTGNAVTSRADDDDRLLATTPGSPYTNTVQVLYASFTVMCTNLPNGVGSYFASFYSTSKGFFGRVQAFTNGTVLPRTWRLGVSANGSPTNAANGGYPVDLALNTPYQVVEELDPVNLYAATIWINPINLSDTGLSPNETHYTSSDSIGTATALPAVNAYAFRQASSFGNGFWIITNLVLTTTFAEAATNIWATNALPPTIVYQPVGATNFIGAAISLSVVANGQGLGNMTYQWKQNGNNYTGGSGGTANVLSISSAQTSDSGNFTLVATTPYGLSVTSSIATVLISGGTNPPSFTSQPVSQAVYGGQTVIFSTTVISPGTPAYTWYSNNVVIAGQTASTLELDNVTTNFAASYKVAVTNNLNPNGIVSTNAVLTVINPQQVTIAYLRTLVDPLNGYNPTNSPPTIAYQVTGTVTTFTNLTTGTTSSYYLQDGTAGINIFVTGATFRPAQGDVVTFIGVLSGYPTGLELYADTADTSFPYTSYTDTGATNALPTPITIPFDVTTNLNNVNYNIAGSLVKLTDVYFGTNSGLVLSTTANNTITVTNSSGKKFNLFFAYLDQNTAGQTLPSYAYSVSGAMYGMNTNFSVAVTRFADIVTAAPSPIPLNLAYSGGILTFNWSDASFLLQSATNVVGPYTTISGANSGFITNTTSAPAMFFRLYHP
jgi:Immunoglobulin domain